MLNQCTADITGKILIFPALSIGAVGTIALDMLIANNQFERIGFLKTRCLEPCVGLLPHDIKPDTLGLPAQLYCLGDVLILQLRSRLRTGRKQDFLQELKNLIIQYKFREVIMISSLSNSNRPDVEIRSEKNTVYVKVKGQSSIKTDRFSPFTTLYDQDDKETDESEILEYSGLGTKAFQVLPRLTGVFMFADRIWDIKTALSIANHLKKVLELKEISADIVKIPKDETV